MLIESRLRRFRRRPDPERNVGCKVDLFGETYFFHARPEWQGCGRAHVCEVTDRRAIDALLSMPEHFNQYGKPPLTDQQLSAMVDRRKYPVLAPDPRTWIEDALAQPAAVFSHELRFNDQPIAGSC